MSKPSNNASIHSLSFFGYGPFKPRKLQNILNNAKAFLVFLTLANIVQGITINGLLKVNVTSIERRFNLLSSESGLIISTYDVAGCLTLLPVSYLGGRGHKPRWIGIGLLVTSVGIMTLALPHFITGPYAPDPSGASNSKSSSPCSAETRSNENDDIEAFCAERERNSGSESSVSLNNMKYVFMLGQFLIGVGSTPFAALSLTFLDDSVDPSLYPVYIGVYYMGALIGPAIGFIIGGKLLNVFTELVPRDDINTESPQWVGAWWVGFVMCSVMMLFIAIPILGFPKRLRSTLTRQKTVTDFKSLRYTSKTLTKSTLSSVSNAKPSQLQAVKNIPPSSATNDQETPLMEMSSYNGVVQSDNQELISSVYESATTELRNAVTTVKSGLSGRQNGETENESVENSNPVKQKVSRQIEQEVTATQIEPDQQAALRNGALAVDDANNDVSSSMIFRSNRVTAIPTPEAKETCTDIVRIFFKDLVIILTHKAFISLSLAAAVLGTIVSGFSTFGAKFVESQFSRSASDAANVFGFIFLPASAIGLALGSFLMSGMKLRHRKALLMCFIVSVLGLFAQLIIILSCGDIEFAGINVPYLEESSVIGTPPNSLNSSCNVACSCPFNAFNPVCGEDGVTYYSPCSAACHSAPEDTQDFSDCSCIASSRSITSNTTNSTAVSSNISGTATSGKCASSCEWQALILTSLFFVVTTTFMCAIPGADLSLRCFPRDLRSLSVGVQWILIRTLGTIPGPIIFGSMIDSTCALWNKVDPCANGLGSCVMYRNQELSFSMLILSMIFKGASVLCFGIAWLTYVPAALRESELELAPQTPKPKKTTSVEPSVNS